MKVEFRYLSVVLLVLVIELGLGSSAIWESQEISKRWLTRSRRSARVDLSWTANNRNGIVFVYSRDFLPQEISVIQSAANEISKNSCINVNVYSYDKYWKSGDSSNRLFRNFVFITRTSNGGCYADIGMQRGMQRMNLDPWQGCSTRIGVVIHEMVHSLGFDHEHNRPDRDQFVNINFRNIIPGKENDFKIKPYVRAFGKYDFTSIMQYPDTAFARVFGYPTITSKVFGYNVPRSPPTSLSPTDKLKIRYITGCKLNS